MNFYLKNEADVKCCPRCGAKQNFPLIVNPQKSDGKNKTYRVSIKCKKCNNEIFIKYMTRKEVYASVINRNKKNEN